MGLAEIVTLIIGVLKFPDTVLEFVKILQKTPEQKHDDLLKKVAAEAQSFEDTGRPTWE
jgi:hypothetical protein